MLSSVTHDIHDAGGFLTKLQRGMYTLTVIIKRNVNDLLYIEPLPKNTKQIISLSNKINNLENLNLIYIPHSITNHYKTKCTNLIVILI